MSAYARAPEEGLEPPSRSVGITTNKIQLPQKNKPTSHDAGLCKSSGGGT